MEQVGLLDERFFLFWRTRTGVSADRLAGASNTFRRRAELTRRRQPGRRPGSVRLPRERLPAITGSTGGATALHPLTILVGTGLLASMALRSVQALAPALAPPDAEIGVRVPCIGTESPQRPPVAP